MLAAGCSGPNYRPEQASAAQARTELPAPSVTDVAAFQADYRIGPLDKLTVTVFGVSDLTTTGQVDASGNFAMPLIGQTKALGETPASFAKKIEAALGGKYIRDPQVSVTVTEAVSSLVTVEGSVTRPGLYPVVGRTTLIRILAAAGGPTEFAQLREAVVFRTVNGQRMVARFDIRDIRGGRSVDPEIYGNDVVSVGENGGKRLFTNVLQAAPVLGIFYQLFR